MLVQFDSERIVIDNQGLLYDPYYFALAGEDRGIDFIEVMKVVMQQWAEAIAHLESEDDAALLPFGIYDQCTECLEAKRSKDEVVLHCVWLNTEGYTIDLLNLADFMQQSHAVVKASPEKFGVFKQSELIKALQQAEAVSDPYGEGKMTL